MPNPFSYRLQMPTRRDLDEETPPEARYVEEKKPSALKHTLLGATVLGLPGAAVGGVAGAQKNFPTALKGMGIGGLVGGLVGAGAGGLLAYPAAKKRYNELSGNPRFQPGTPEHDEYRRIFELAARHNLVRLKEGSDMNKTSAIEAYAEHLDKVALSLSGINEVFRNATDGFEHNLAVKAMKLAPRATKVMAAAEKTIPHAAFNSIWQHPGGSRMMSNIANKLAADKEKKGYGRSAGIGAAVGGVAAGPVGAAAGAGVGTFANFLKRKKQEKKADWVGNFVDKGFEGKSPEDWKEHSIPRMRLVQALLGAGSAGLGALAGTAGGAAMGGHPGLGAAVGAGAGALLSVPSMLMLQGAKKQLREDPEVLANSYKLHQDRQTEKTSAFEAYKMLLQNAAR